jgi:hypothetical protein
MKKIVWALLLLTGSHVFGQSFYDINTIQEIKIYFGFSNWDYRMDTAIAGSEGYIPADSVIINGTLFTNCGVKYKGNSSYNANRTKNPLHIKLDEYQDQIYQGYEDIKLGNGFSDNSMIREPLAYQILRQYMDAPQANFAKVYINGSYYGIMNNAESIDSRFLMEKYFSSKYAFFKCNPQNAGPGSGNGSSLEYNGTTLSNYNTKYELKSDTGWYELFRLCDTLNNHFAVFDSIADVDRFLWMLTFNNVLVNLDSYSGSFRQNYYLYRNHADQWIPTIWDLNMCFGGFSVAGGTTANLTATTMQTMSYTLHKTESAWPLIYKLLNDPVYSKMYYAHMRTINNENFANANYKTSALAMHNLVDNAVQTDANYLSTYSNFQNSLTTNTTGSGGPGGTCPGIYPLMDARTSYISNVLSATPPTITTVQPSQLSPAYAAPFSITANVTNTMGAYLGFRFSKKDRFRRVQMFDDGNHNDGAAGDNIYGASVTMNGAAMQYYIYAENANTGVFSPERAEYEFYSVTANIPTANSTQIVINEFAVNNNTGIENEKGKYKDWIELYNTTNQALNLSGLYISDSVSSLTKWQFPVGSVIKPNEHLLLWADDLDETYLEMHTNFNLSNTGDAIVLSNGTSVFDSITYGNQIADAAMGRCADGSGNFVNVVGRTPRAVNDCTSGVELNSNDVAIRIFPNPTENMLNVMSDVELKSVEVFSLNGDCMIATNQANITLSQLASGSYIVKVTTADNKIWRSKLIKL